MRIVALLILCALSAAAADEAQKAPLPAKVLDVFTLFYCKGDPAKSTADAPATINAKGELSCLKDTTLTRAMNAPDVVSSLQAATEFSLKNSGDSQVIVFCATTSCPDADIQRLKESMLKLAGGETPKNPPTVEYYPLNFVCPADLADTRPAIATAACATPLVQPSNAKAIAAMLPDNPSYTVTAPDNNHLAITCKKTPCELNQLERVIDQMAAAAVTQHVQDFGTPPGSSQAIADGLQTRWRPLEIRAVGDQTLRVTSQVPLAPDDVLALRGAITDAGFGPSNSQLLTRMFYAAAGTVASASGGGAGNTAQTDTSKTNPGGKPDNSEGGSGSGGSGKADTGSKGKDSGGTAAAASGGSETGSDKKSGDGGNAAGAANKSASEGSGSGSGAAGGGKPDTAPIPGGASAGNNPTSGDGNPPAPPAQPSVPILSGMVSIGDNVVYKDPKDPNNLFRAKLLTMLDLPKPEVLMNLWSLSASSPDGRHVQASAERIREVVSAHNDALEHAIGYGWDYLSRQMKTDPSFFDTPFYQYVSDKFVGCDDTTRTCPEAISRPDWGLCEPGKYCLGYTEAFTPLKPTLTNILLGMMSARVPIKTVLTTIACMEGKYEVYSECFPDRAGIWYAVDPKIGTSPASEAQQSAACLRRERRKILEKRPSDARMSCEALDLVALEAQQHCGVAQSFPMSCFTLQAAKSFFPEHAFATFSLDKLDSLAETPMAETMQPLAESANHYQATPLGLLRSAVVDFLFNYKMASQFPLEFGSYDLTHSAQTLNAQFNPLVTAFNQDVVAFTRYLMDGVQEEAPNKNHWYQIWRRGQSFINDGMVMVRGIGGLPSNVDTLTESFVDATEAVTLKQFLQNIGAGSSDGTGSTLDANLTRDWTARFLNAITPAQTSAHIGRQLTLNITPHSLAGASSAELDVQLTAQDEAPPTLYSAGSNAASGNADPLSRVARHNVTTKVRVESVKLFDVSSFSALVERPRSKFPLVPPFVELPYIGTLAGVPLPAAKEYHRSTAIVSAIIVPTAADLAYGIVYAPDRGMIFEDAPQEHPYRLSAFRLYRYTSMSQFRHLPIFPYHKAMLQCLATGNRCGETFFDVAPEY